MAIITGTPEDDELTGTAADDTINGLAGNDTLNGMAGANILVGGLGDDTYEIGLGQDTIVELGGQGTDTVRSSISYTLGSNLENLILSSTVSDILRFVEPGEVVSLTRVVDSANSIVGSWHFVDSSGEGAVTFLADGTYFLAEDGVPDLTGGPGMEHGTFTWNPVTGAFTSNTVTDTSGDWGLSDAIISDVQLVGDTLTLVESGETLVLTRVADAGNPIVGTWHFIDSSGEAALTFLADGSYLLAEDGDPDSFGHPGMEHGTYTWNAVTGAFNSNTTTDTNGEWGLSEGGITNLQLLSSSGSGNALDNVIEGNEANNVLSGLAGNDTLVGNGGNDTLNGGLGNDRLDGGAGDDAMIGGAGNDTYVVDSAADSLTELAAQGTDTVESFLSYALGANFEDLTLVGADAIDGTGNAVNNVITGNGAANILTGGLGNDRLDGGAGDDAMIGGAGNDTYIVDSVTDSLMELDAQGTDTVESILSYTLGATLENLMLMGADAIDGTGNAANNVITGNGAANVLAGGTGNDTLIGNAGNDTLDGGIGIDTMIGGAGDDTYFVDVAADVVTELAGAGTDTVNSAVSYTSGATLENVTLVGSATINATGNALGNVLAGNSGNNTLLGGAGNDELSGGAGNDKLDGGLGADAMSGGLGDDTYVLDNAGDTVTENPGEGIDTVQVGVGTSYSIADLANIENVTLLGTVASVVGNAANNVLTGNAAANVLQGGDGNDTLDGGTGADFMYGGEGDDIYVVDSVGDKVIEGSPQAPSTVIASTLTDGSPGQEASNATISGDGQFVVFQSQSPDFASSGPRTHIFLKDLDSGDLTRLDVPPDPNAISTGSSTIPLISADGSIVAFQSYDSTLVSPPASNPNVYVSHVGNPNVDLISEKDGTRGNGVVSTDVSADGKFVLFVTVVPEPVLTGPAGNGALQSVVMADTTTGDLAVVSYNGVAPLGGAASFQSKISSDAHFVGFSSTTTNLVSGDTNGVVDVFVRELDLAADAVGAFTRVSTSSTGVQANLSSNMADISSDGRYVLFNSSATNLIVGDTNAKADVFVKDRVTGETTRVSTSSTGLQGNADGHGTSISGDGRYVLFDSTASNLVAGDTNAEAGVAGTGFDLFIKDRVTGLTALVTRDDDGVQIPLGAGFSLGTLSDDGRYVVFGTTAQLTGDDADFGMDIYRVANPLFIEAGGGTDEVRASVTYTLSADIENLTLTGASAINGTGNAGNNIITGNAAANTLNGLAGADEMIGLGGNDTYVVDSTLDVTTEALAGGIDTVQSSAANFTLADNVENLTLVIGAGDINGTGNALNNILLGNAGDNRLDGKEGADTMTGGLGNDTYVVDALLDKVIEGVNGGTDTVESSVSLTLAANVENLTLTGGDNLNATGNALINTLTGNEGDNILNGGAGIDQMIGGQGNDTYVLDNTADVITEIFGDGNDTAQITYNVSATVPTLITLGDPGNFLSIENVLVTGTGLFNLTGNEFNNTLTGNASANTLTGLDGNDTLDGGLGNDTLIGGIGDDTYVVNSLLDAITENASEGIDTVKSTVTLTLGANLEHLTLLGAAVINATGNALANTLTGNAAANTLNGLAGADEMIGLGGNDTYVVDSTLDVTTEALAGGIDTVQSSAANFTLGDNVENLTLVIGAGDINGTGNALNNILLGNAGDNRLDGKEGADTMTGGAGDDTYVVDNALDKVQETIAGVPGGTDTVESSVSLTLAANVENLTLTGGDNLNATGNALINTLTGNEGDNILNGGAGIDQMIGGQGNDTYVLDNTADVITEIFGDGNDTAQITYNVSATVPTLITLGDPGNFLSIENVLVTGTGLFNLTGNEFNNTLTGNASANTLTGLDGNDTLDGGLGNDTLIGGIGDDTYVVNSLLDAITENASEGIDTVKSTVTLTLGANLEHLTLLGAAVINATGNALANTLTGNAAANTLNGLAGADEMIGLGGNDTYVVDSTLDVTTEALAGGIDTVQSSAANFTLGDNVENLTLVIGAGDINGTGNALNNILLGNAGDNRLDGKEGADTMTGGAGDDTYVVDNALDKVQETIAGVPGGTDTVESSVSLTLAANVENLTLTGGDNLNATGNALINTLTGNEGDNILNGGAGIDQMIGGQGNDTYVLDNTADVITEIFGDGNDTAQITYNVSATVPTLITLGDPGNFLSIENVLVTGTGLFNLTGNEFNNTLTGNASANTLTGLDGNDTLDGGLGNDTLIGGIGDDTYVVNSLLDAITENASEGIDTVKSTVTLTLGANLEHLTLLGAAVINATGNALANTLTGNAAANLLNGGADTDTLFGKGGLDTLTGGADADTFVFDTAPGTTNRDSITDFVHGQDHMAFDLDIFAGAGVTGALDPAKFHSGAGLTTATEADDRFVYNTTSGALYYDADGAGGSAAIQVVTLTNHAPIDSTDILIV